MSIKKREWGQATVSLGDRNETPKMEVNWKTETVRQIFVTITHDPSKNIEPWTGIKFIFKYKIEEEKSDTPIELVHVMMNGKKESDFHKINLEKMIGDDGEKPQTQEYINRTLNVFKKSGYKFGKQEEIPVNHLLNSISKEMDAERTMYA